MLFRAHVKSHKTTEGSLMQLCQTDDNSAKGEGSLVISTIPEGWGLLEGGVLDGGKVGNVSLEKYLFGEMRTVRDSCKFCFIPLPNRYYSPSLPVQPPSPV
jgi:hypothetical protein